MSQTSRSNLLLVDDEKDFLEVLQASLASEGFEIESAADGVEAINKLQKGAFDVVLLDIRMPRVDGLEVLQYVKDNTPDTEVIMLSGVQDISIAVDAMQRGAYSYLPKPFNKKELTALIHRALDKRKLTVENRFLRTQVPAETDGEEIIAESPAMKELLSVAAKVAPTDSPVLVQGPSGTGKELLARLIYRKSNRSTVPFVSLNCAAIPETLIESELFGYMKGAFTDAKETRTGLVDMAHRGTIFLDEIGEISPAVQPKLLRFLQFGEFRRVGGKEPLHADVRVISATNRDLSEDVKEGRFREDLLYRINVITLDIPALKERREDIPALVRCFLSRRRSGGEQLRIDPKALEILTEYHWPGNVRELENVIERASIMAEGGIIQPTNIVHSRRPMGPGPTDASNNPVGQARSLEEIERLHIAGVLRSVAWNKKTAAGILSISLKTLYTKIHKYRLTEHAVSEG